ncbi:hypothetical protein [Sneathiella chinensis]|uniref:Uncharacterized protein n=1 Tax=Sneathiella chinensis TaxID=349750 RepID=A0ABQ5U4L2_9PROT|nr:hypothetical protein [Sneathiella chinensis]GLQ06605.1 hypothetical protein GCM10007924_18260 [Sneathiella chinensis]
MTYTEAFKKLGYDLISPRQDWSAEKDDGICVAVWQQEIKKIDNVLTFDSKLFGAPHEEWGRKSGNKKRTKHLQRALSDFNGNVDMVIVTGSPERGYKEADPWHPKKRRNQKWKVTYLDEETGHCTFKLE